MSSATTALSTPHTPVDSTQSPQRTTPDFMSLTSFEMELERMARIVRNRADAMNDTREKDYSNPILDAVLPLVTGDTAATAEEIGLAVQAAMQQRQVECCMNILTRKRLLRDRVSDPNKAQIRVAVEAAVKNGTPIPIGFLWSYGGQAQCDYKFREPLVNLPRTADLWTIFWFMTLNNHIKRYHPPGIEVLIVDEVPQLEMVGITGEAISRRQAVMHAVAARYAPFIRFMDLPYFSEITSSLEVGEPLEDVVYTMITTMRHEEPLPDEVYDHHYNKREKPWDEIKSLLPEGLWDTTVELCRRMSAVWAARKQVAFMASQFDGRPYIDACLVEKGRWSPKIHAFALPQHGGTVLITDDEYRYSVEVVPESRLVERGYRPVMVSANEILTFAGITVDGAIPPYFTLYWVAPPDPQKSKAEAS